MSEGRKPTSPGITEQCTPDQLCPKALDPSGLSWADGCWCYRNQSVKVWVVVSDCGLNGPWIHGVAREVPGKAILDACSARASRTTGYLGTMLCSVVLDGEWQ